MIIRKELYLEFACSCCGKTYARTYNLLSKDDQPPDYPPNWTYVNDAAYYDESALFCPSCWHVFEVVSKVVK